MKKFTLFFILLLCGISGFVQSQTISVISPNGSEIWPACATRTISWAGSSTSGYYNVDYSTNGGTTWASIATFLNATSLNWTVPNVQSTTCLVRVLDSYNNLIVDQSNAVFTINASVRVTAPNGGESWQVGNPSTRDITWVASGTGTYLTIEYSIDAGNSWNTITTAAVASSGLYTWTIPNTPSTQCLVRIRDNNTPCMQDVSDNLFTIVAPTPTITVTSPNTAVTWYVGYSYTIQWTSQYVTNPYVAIDYSTDGGTTWTSIISSTNNSGTYNWASVPNTPSNQCRVRVKDASNPSTNDISNVNFTIAVPVWTITVSSPNGGESWSTCNSYTISWSNTFVTGNYKVEYSTDNGGSWNTIVSSTSSSSITWQVPNTIATSSQCLIKVSSVTNPSVYDVSNATFTITQVQYIIVTSPNGGESWQVGSPATRAITWVYTGTGAYFNLEYSIDNGVTWIAIANSYYAPTSPASYTWTLPNNPSNNCLVRVSDYANTCRNDVSNAVFAILAPTPVITVTSPNTAVTWYVGSTYSINWTSQYVTNPFVAIEYSTDNGTTWTTIVATTNNTGAYSWTIPNTPSTQCLVRVKDASNPSTNDVSNVNFTIAVPVSSITVASPNGGENWNSCSSYSITWSQSNVTGNFKIEYSTDGGSTWATIVSSVAGTSYTWQVPNTIATSNQCLIRVSSVSNPSITDISNATFTINRLQYIIINSPNGGESWQVGNPTTRTINWVYTGTGLYFNLEYSIDGGATWIAIATNYYAPTSPASYTWTIPNNPSNNCMVRVSDYANTCRNDVSDAVFAIIAPTPVVTVTSPNTAVTWYVGSVYSISWTTQYVTDPFVTIEYSVDSGATWINIIAAINTASSPYTWTVPNTPSNRCLVRVKSTSNPSTIFDVSNVVFTIATPVWTITVASPNGGETWNSCSSYSITWSNTWVTGNYKIEYSTDNGSTWNLIATTAASSYTWQVPNTIPTSNQCLIKVSSVTNPSVYDVSNAIFTINQVQYIVVTSPNGGESWQVANPATRAITWAYTGTGAYFNLEYSIDGGTSWIAIATNYYAPTSPASYTWTIPNNPSTNCLVRVSDYANTCRNDVSNAVFAIVAPTPVITVTSPNTAVTWYVGSSYSISWTTAYVTDPFVAIEYSTDGGISWSSIVSTINTSATPYTWTVPNTPSTQCLVRVKSTANPSTIYDISNVNFTIATPVWTITVASPNGGETWNSCSSYSITWSNTWVTGNYKVEYSTDNGATWNMIATTAASSYTWQVPNTIPTSNQCLIKVSSVTNPTVFDVSNATFTINQVQYIIVTSPNGGESWQVANPATRAITWAYTGTGAYFNLEYSIDNGVSWIAIATNYYAPTSPASYTWTIPNNPSANCLVRVSDYANTCRNDVSNAVFAIVAPTPVITVTSPNTAVTWYVGSSYSISWTTAYVTDPFVSIEYSTDNGTTWSTIVATINTASSPYTWTVPNTPSAQCLVRVKSTANPSTIFDVSNVNFTIATPVWTITVASPNGGETWNSCSSYSITWSNNWVTGNYKVEYSTDNGATWNLIATTAASSYTWQVPNNIPTSNQCLIKVSSVTNPTVFDVSNATFTINQTQYIVVTSPVGGESWQVANPATRAITWAYTGTGAYFNLEYSIDNGVSWIAIATNYYAPTSPASYTWTIPNNPSTQCLVRISDYANTCRNDVSNAVFTIVAPTPVITVTSPNTGVTWGIGGNYNITWTSSYVTDPFVAIDYSIDGGATWTNIVTAVNTTAGTYTWTVPNTPSNQCRVRVRDNVNASVYDISNVNFSIVPAITVTSPNGGENWGGCTVTSVTWTAYGTSGNFKIEYSLDNGVNWTTVVSSYAAGGPNCTYTWTIPHASSSTSLVRVTDASSSTKTDMSNAVFSMFPAIVVTNPAANVAVFANQTLNITWTATGVSNYYNIDYSINGGSTWTSIVFNTLIMTNSYAWTVPASLSTNCLVRVTDYQNSCKQDISDGAFTIAASVANVVVTAPNGNENYMACGSQTINWSAQGTSGNYNLEYSTNGGSSWLPIVSGYSAPGQNCSYTWTIPNSVSSNCLVRITDAANSSRTDQSNAIFNISAFSIGAVAASPSVCTGAGTVLSGTGAATYTWQPGNLSGTSVAITPATSTTYTVTGILGACSAITTVPVTVNALPTVNATTSASNICTGGTATLTGSGASTYQWSPAGSLNVSNIASPVASPASTTTYTVVGTNASGCSNTATVTVNVTTAQSVIATATQTSICPGDNVTLSATGATTYTWMPGNISGSTLSVSPSSTTTYSVTGVAGSCSATNTITITVNPPPVVSCSATQTTICSGASTTLTASGATTYTWMPGNLTGASVSVTPGTSTTYTVTGANGSCTNTNTISITVNPSPTVAVTGNSSICTGGNATLTATGANSYTWMPGNLTGASITVAPSSTTTYTVTGMTGSCTGTGTTTLTVNTTPTVSASSSSTICTGGSTTISASGATTYTWMPGNLSGASVTVSPTATTTYTVTGTSLNGCSGTANTTITVVTPPTVSLSGNTTICSGGNTTLTANGAVTYNWMPGNLSGNSVTVSPSGTTTYTVTGTAGTCTDTRTITVTVNPTPTVTATASQATICNGSTTTLSGNGATTYTWQPGNLTGSSVTVTPAATTTYTLTGANGSCISTSTVAVTVQNVPVVSVSGTTAICTGNSTTLTASGATSYMWQPGNFPGTSIAVAPSSNTTYTVTGTSGVCTGTQTVAVTVAASPTVTATASNLTVCSGGTSVLTASGASAYTWMPGNISGNNVTVNPVSTTTYTVTGVNGSCSATNTVTVTVNTFVPVTIAGNSAICSGNNATLTASGATTYTWQPGNLSGSSVSVSPSSTTTYTVTGTSGSCSGTQTMTLTVNTTPNVTALGGGGICSGNTATLTASGASNYNWLPINQSGSSITVTPSSTTTYSVIGTNPGGCSDTAVLTVSVNPSPVLTASSSSSLCTGNSATLSASGASTYNWMPGNFSTSSITVSPSSTTTYTVTGSNGSCTATQTMTITVNTTPNVTALGSGGICSGNTATLTASGASNYNWLPINQSGSSITVTPSSTTTYSVIGTNPGGCSDTAVLTVSVNPSPVLTTSGSSSLCTGNSATLSASGASTYNWMPGNFSTSSITVSPSSTTTYTVTGSNGSCTATQTMTITVNTTPNVTALGGGGICSGNTATLTASGASSYTWLPVNQSGSSITVAPTSTTTYSVIGTNIGGCTDTAFVSVAVNPTPTVTVTGAGTICPGNTTTLSASGASAYTWQPGNLSGSSIAVSPSATTTYTVTGVNASGCTTTAYATVTVSPSPVVSVTGGGNSCAGASVVLSATGASTYNWQPGNLSGNNVTVAPTSSTTYTVTGTNSNGCTATNTVAITVTPAPSVSLTASQTSLCAGGTSNLSASGANSYSWFPGNISGSSIVAAPSVTTTYSVVGTNGIGCTDTAVVTITVNPAPAITVSGSSAVCAGVSSTLTASGAASYNWMPGNLNSTSITVAPAVTTTYTVTGISANGCSGTGFATITVNPAPVVIASGSSNLCSGSSSTLNASGASTYTWQPGNLNGASVSITPASTTLYVVTGTDANGCSANDSFLVTIDPVPVVTASTLQNSFCAGGSTTLTASGAGSYIWQPGNLTGNSVSVSPATTTTYTVTGTSGNCSSSAQITITVLPAPSIVITGNTTVCNGSSTTLNATGASTYSWQPGNLSGSSVTVSPVSTTNYLVTGTDANGCTGTGSVTVNIAPFPTVNASANNSVICAGDAVILNAAGADLYNWMPGNIGGSSVSVSPAVTTTYTVVGTNAGGCNDTTTVSVTVNPLPSVSFSLADDTTCQSEAPFVLTGGSPAGGVYSGQGVVGGQFDPMTAGIGLHQISYTFTDANTGCDNTATQLIYVDACAGMGEVNADAFAIYPNPSHELFTISYPGFTEPVRIELYNSIGELIGNWMMTGDRLDIEVSTLPVGVYQLTIYSADGIVTKKVVKI